MLASVADIICPGPNLVTLRISVEMTLPVTRDKLAHGKCATT